MPAPQRTRWHDRPDQAWCGSRPAFLPLGLSGRPNARSGPSPATKPQDTAQQAAPSRPEKPRRVRDGAPKFASVQALGCTVGCTPGDRIPQPAMLVLSGK